jgi:hypothetical protein
MTPAHTADAAVWAAPWLMNVSLAVHIVGGTLAILSGYVAVAAPKGRPTHRVAGTVFFGSMLAMTSFALVMALAKDQPINIMAASFALYMVFTAWLTARRPEGTLGWLEAAACLWALLVAAYGVLIGAPRAGGFATVVLVFAGLAGLGAVFDIKVMVQRGVAGVGRISRHLWRMCTAFFVATGSFFMGQMDEIPEAWRGPHLYVLAFAPLVLLIIWMIRVRMGPGRRAAAADTGP